MVEEIPNSEIFLIYEAKLCNPNGDPDAENRPRIDAKTGINLVSDVRLKRFFRDYVVEKFGEDFIYVTKVKGENVRADTRVRGLLNIKEEIKKEEVSKLLNRCIDARLFGATVPIGKGEEKRGGSFAFIGPVQFTWGFSFHKVEMVESSTITSVFSGREEAERYGTMGKDWRLYYSLIGFYGVISGRRAKQTHMTGDDLKVLDNLLWKSLQIQPTTRSKIGERPHLYLRIEYKDADTLLGDLRRYVKVTCKDTIRNFEDVNLDFSALFDHLGRYRERISSIYINISDELSYLKKKFEEHFPEIVRKLPHELSDEDILKTIKREAV